MKKNEIFNTIKQTYNKVNFNFKKHSPEIFIIAGVTGTVVSAIMACRATTKIGVILDDTKEKIDMIHDCVADEGDETYTEADGRKELALVYAKAGLEFTKLYGPSIFVGTLSITSILASNNILRKRNAALAAAYATVDKGFKEYRARVAERFGDDVEKEIRYNLKAQQIEEQTVDENGKKKKVKNTVTVADPNLTSPYARYFDESNKNFQENPEYNLFFLKSIQNWATDKLRAQGHLFLNEVFDELGIVRVPEGQVVGWVYTPDNQIGDNFVDFGIYETNKVNEAFVHGLQPIVLLDFNVDGNVLDLM